ncbi:hypothetical protein GGS21DRAFT_548856 [Xylaria nigripes]|nr:hypothetical protein GGS21DRAFT_548856 [Xylaria nigripes]
MKSNSEFHLFGGQGWSGLFHDRVIAVAIHDANASRYAEELLLRCHKALILDITSLCLEGDQEAVQFLSTFASPTSLLRLPGPLQTHPCFQGITLCLFQLLRFLAEIPLESTYENSFNQIAGTTGLCSGILPAIVIASSRTVGEFIENGVQAFRAIFWIGYRAGEYSQRILPQGESGDGVWTYNLSGVSLSQLTDMLCHFNLGEKEEMQVTLAGILRDSNYTVSGSSAAFKKFLDQIPVGCAVRPVHVRALYHGGERLAPIVKIIMRDYESHNVKFPSYGDLRRDVFNPVDGSKLSEGQSYKTLLQDVVEMILIKPFNWSKILSSLTIETTRRMMVVYGPHPHFLMPSSMVSGDTGVQRRDLSHENPSVQLKANFQQSDKDIAIIGVGLDLPNGSTLDEVWDSLKGGMNFVSPTPEDRFPKQERYKQDTHATPLHGNYIQNPWAFDNTLFGISPREAKCMDPQQRILLQCAFHALQHAGYVADTTKTFQRETFGCYVASATGDYVERMSEKIDVYYSPGTLRSFLSGRISHCFGWTGPSVVVDTACSGSLVAIHQACRALIANECGAALAGGVNIICSPDMQRGLARARFLSPTGQCRPFDADADGYCRAEGAAMFVLKRLSDAVAENDRILGVIKGTGINQSGNADSITHPHAETQKILIQSVLTHANVLPGSITAVEAHGTGTQAGDPIEFDSISAVLGKGRAPTNPLILSSIKGNIGHAEAASGGAGLAKLLMMINKGQAPPQVGLKTLNPKIAAMKDDSIIIPDHLLIWPRFCEMPRRALINNFGAAGSNACLILEEYVLRKDRLKKPKEAHENSGYVFVLSATDDAALERYRQVLLQDASLKTMRLRDLAYTSTARRTMLDSRLVLTASTSEELFQSIRETSLSSREPSVIGDSRPRVVFVFSGQGSQYLGMGKELFETTTSFRDDILQCERILADAGYASILPLIQPSTSSTQSLDDYGTQATHCAVFAIEYSLARLYMSWGIRPDAMLGHSLGEYAAFVHAGVLKLEDALLIVAHRAILIEAMCEVGTSSMLSINASAEKVQCFLSEMAPTSTGLTIACDNSLQQCVVSGPTDKLGSLAAILKKNEIKNQKLGVPYGFHSPVIEPISQPFDEYVSKVRLQEPTVPLGLALYGRMHRAGDINHDYFVSQAVNRVRFRETAEDFSKQYAKDATVCLEIGPHPVVNPMLKAILPQASTKLLGSLRRDTRNWASVCQSVAHFVRCGFEIDFAKIYEGQDAQLVDMPLYPFHKEEFVVPYIAPSSQQILSDNSTSIAQTTSSGPLLSMKSAPSMLSQDQTSYYANERIEEFIKGHRVAGLPLCPASVYIELALQAAQNAQRLKGGRDGGANIIAENIVFSSPIVLHDMQLPSDMPVKITLDKTAGRLKDVSFKVDSQVNGATQKNCEGRLSFSDEELVDTAQHLDKMNPNLRGFQEYGQLIKRKMLYETIFSRVVAYSELYRTIDHLELSDSGHSARGSFRLRQPAILENCVSQPVFVDTLLHAAGFLANCSVSAADVCICNGIDSVHVRADTDYSESFRLYTEITSTHRSVIGNSYAYDSDGKLVGSVRGIAFRRLGKESFTRSLQGKTPNKHSLPHGDYQSIHDMNSGQASNGPSIPMEPKAFEFSSATAQTPKAPNVVRNDGAVTSALTISTAPTADQIHRIVAEVAGIPKDKVNGKSNLQQIGLDSFMIFELLDMLKVRLGMEISHNEIESCKISDDIVRLVNQQASQSAELPASAEEEQVASKCLALIRKGPDDTVPIYLIHDGSGVCSMYSAIGNLGRKIFGISCDPERVFQSISEMALGYAKLINTTEPFIVGGWSFGGVVAQEVARILHEQRAPVLGVVMVDSPCPTTHEGIPMSILQRLCKGKPEWLLRNFETHSGLLRAWRPTPATVEFPMVLLRSAEAEQLGDEWCSFLSDGPERHELVCQWRQLVGPQLRVIEVPGSHFAAFNKEIVGDTSRAMSQAIDMIQEARNA